MKFKTEGCLGQAEMGVKKKSVKLVLMSNLHENSEEMITVRV